MKFKFDNFFNDKKIYIECVEYWAKLFRKELPNIEFEKYFNTTYSNGEDFFDANPIFNFKVKNSNRAVFIVQEEPESETVYFKAWIDKFEADDETIEKLVIILELTEQSEYHTIDLVKKWIVQQKSPENLEREIKLLASIIPNKLSRNIYSEIFNLERSEKIVSPIIKQSSSKRSSKLLELLPV